MTQNYTPVAWQDETTSQQGTLINAERLNQMQQAHHYADGFEEVDAIPTADPGVTYHKVVYCTADSTFYRWDGTEWTADIDDDTKRLLLEHEADHDNPHQVTKAQVGLGNADNTSDQNKPVSTAQAAAIKLVQDYLDAHEANHNNPHQVTKAQVGLGNADNTADADKPISTAAQTALDGKVAIIPVTTGVKFYAQTSGGTYLYQGTQDATAGITSVPLRDSSGRIRTATPSGDTDAVPKKYVDDGLATKADKATTLAGYGITDAYSKTEADTLLGAKADTTALTDGSVTKVGTANVGTDTKPIKLVGGVPTAVTNDLATLDTAQTFTANKKINLQYAYQDWVYDDSSTTAHKGLRFYAGSTSAYHGDLLYKHNISTGIYSLEGSVSGNGGSIVAGIKVDNNGKATAYVPTPSAGAGATEVATVGYVSDTGGTLNNLVHTNGNETVNGMKLMAEGVLGNYSQTAVAATSPDRWHGIQFKGVTTQFLKFTVADYINNGSSRLIEGVMFWNGGRSNANVFVKVYGPAYSDPTQTLKVTIDSEDNFTFWVQTPSYHSVFRNSEIGRSWSNNIIPTFLVIDNPDWTTFQTVKEAVIQ